MQDGSLCVILWLLSFDTNWINHSKQQISMGFCSIYTFISSMQSILCKLQGIPKTEKKRIPR